jgi:hypothetical protein
MEENETAVKDTMQSILEIFLRSKHGSRSSTSYAHKSMKIYALPEEGVHLIHAFIRIKQPELRAAIIKLVTQMANH